MSTTIGAMFSPIGNAIGQLIPTILVSESKIDSSLGDDSSNYTIDGMITLMAVELAIIVIPFILAVIFFEEVPPTPPSLSTKKKIDRNNDESESNSNQLDQLKEETLKLLGNNDYLVLFITFSIGVGFFNALLTLLNQIVSPHGYSNDDAGLFGALFIVFGLVGAAIAGVVMGKTKRYREILKIGILLCVFSTTLFLLMLYSNNFGPLLLSFAIMGFTIVPMLPVMVTIHIDTDTYIHPYIQPEYNHTYIHTYMHTYIYTYIHVYI